MRSASSSANINIQRHSIRTRIETSPRRGENTPFCPIQRHSIRTRIETKEGTRSHRPWRIFRGIPLEQGLRPIGAFVIKCHLASIQRHSIRTRIETVKEVMIEVKQFAFRGIPLEQGLRHFYSQIHGFCYIQRHSIRTRIETESVRQI